jgi:peptidoglycan hydrolase-like protein with peptidoglycan-binding domain
MARRSVFTWAALGFLAAIFTAVAPASAGAPTVSAANPENSVAATPSLVRQVQFMLLSIGIDPGPIDGVPRRLTNTAVHKFEEQFGLPAEDLVSGGQISTALLDSLRKAASGVLLGTESQRPAAGATPTPPASPQPAIAMAPPHLPPPVDRFAACPLDPADLLIGGTQYTPDSFLRTGFGGSTATAVDTLNDRLQQARQVAQQIGGPAQKEVQRQARVLAYFECRLKIEQASAGKN